MIVVPSWEGQGQLKTLGTLVLVKQTLALKSRDTRHNSAGWCWLSQCYSSAEWTVRTERSPHHHIWPRSGRGMSHPEPSHPHQVSWAWECPHPLLVSLWATIRMKGIIQRRHALDTAVRYIVLKDTSTFLEIHLIHPNYSFTFIPTHR